MASSPPNPQPEPGRRHPVHWPYQRRDNLSVVIFVTVCAQDRRPIFHHADAVTAIREAWTAADAWVVGRYVILPDHVHLFCSPVRADVSLQRWVQYWKSHASTRWPRPDEQPVWQRHFWDTQLRHGDSYAAKWEYVRSNPVRHHLVAHPDDWPWAGEIEPFDWHDP